jgi:fermentation-respiration switch protein FrsA (DUF1100 family)
MLTMCLLFFKMSTVSKQFLTVRQQLALQGIIVMTRIVIYAIVILVLFLLSRWRVGQMFYYPDRTVYDTPASHGLRFEEVFFPSSDGTRLSGWFIPAIGSPKGTVIHFHGNAENMTAHFAFVSWLPAAGFNLFVFDYRGYGKSAGKPDRKGLCNDSVAAINHVASRKDVAPDRLLLLGQSLGGANAIVAAVRSHCHGIRAVAIESAFASYQGIVREKIGQIPVLSLAKSPLAYLLSSDAYSPLDVVAQIAPVPLLFIYGTDDPIVSPAQGRALYEQARQPKVFWTLLRGEHLDAFADPSSPYRQKLVTFFESALAGKTVSP